MQNKKSCKFYTFLLKNYPHQSIWNTVYIQNCYSNRAYTQGYCSYLYDYFILFFSLHSHWTYFFLSLPLISSLSRRPPCLAPLQPNHHHHHHHHHHCNPTTIATHPIVMSDHFQNKRERERERVCVGIWNNKNDYLKKIYCIIDKLM